MTNITDFMYMLSSFFFLICYKAPKARVYSMRNKRSDKFFCFIIATDEGSIGGALVSLGQGGWLLKSIITVFLLRVNML